MPAPTPGYVKNMISRSLREIVDPSPTKANVEKIWKFFDSECAYCGKQVDKLKKEGHIDHLFPASLGGPNHISNRVLSCVKCNEAEKLDGEWHEFILKKNKDPEVARKRIALIREWQEINEKPVLDKEKLQKIEELGDLVAVYYDVQVKKARKLRQS